MGEISSSYADTYSESTYYNMYDYDIDDFNLDDDFELTFTDIDDDAPAATAVEATIFSNCEVQVYNVLARVWIKVTDCNKT